MIYRREEESIEDLIQYPLYVWDLESAKQHPNIAERNKYADYLRKELGNQHREHKRQMKEILEKMNAESKAATDKRSAILREQILDLARINAERLLPSE